MYTKLVERSKMETLAVGLNFWRLKGGRPMAPRYQKLFVVFLCACSVASADTLWLGNDAHPPAVQTDLSGNPTGNIITQGITGFAWDGTVLYSSTATGEIDKRQANGAFISSFVVPNPTSFSEDMAWDSARNRLWRTEHQGKVERINPTTGLMDFSFLLPTGPISASGVTITNPGALGVAYDSLRDQLYISFCEAGCATFARGVIMEFNPVTGAMVGGLFGASGTNSIIGGLAYDAIGDTIWGGGVTDRHFTRTGTVLSSFANPTPFSDGLEILQAPIPEPSSVLLVLSGLGVVSFLIRKRAKTV